MTTTDTGPVAPATGKAVLLADILDPFLLHQHIQDGNVRAQNHPTLPYTIYNYTEKYTYAGLWDDVTRTCRGLITNNLTREVLARPFRKFFNHNQPEAPALDLVLQRHLSVDLSSAVVGLSGLPLPATAVP